MRQEAGEVAQLLLEAGARSDARSSAGDTAMHIASREGLEHIATMLLDLSGPDGPALNASNIAGEVRASSSPRMEPSMDPPPWTSPWTPAQPLTSPYCPTATYPTLLVPLPPLSPLSPPLSLSSPPPTDECTPPPSSSPALVPPVCRTSHQTPLHLAMSANSSKHARIARMLLSRGAFAFGRTRSGETVMHACARENNVQLASLILSRSRTSETVDALNAKANNGMTPLHVAVWHNQEDMVKLLLQQEGIDRGAADNEGNTPILTACHRGDIILLQRLLRAAKGADERDLRVRNALGWSALHTASFKGQDVAVRLLLRFQAPVNQLTADGWTALHLACAEGHVSCVTSLLAAGATLDMHHVSSGESALGLAAARGHSQVVTQLLRAGASPAARADAHGWTPMHAALVHGEADVAVQLLEGGGRIRFPRDLKDHKLEPGQWVGDPIDLAHPFIRTVMMEADEKRRVKNRMEGRDSDDGGEWEVEHPPPPPPDPPMPHWPAPPEPKTLLLLPDRYTSEGGGVGASHPTPYLPDASHTRDEVGRRSGYFGYLGDPLLYSAHRPITM